jgi:hypothetical protein
VRLTDDKPISDCRPVDTKPRPRSRLFPLRATQERGEGWERREML